MRIQNPNWKQHDTVAWRWQSKVLQLYCRLSWGSHGWDITEGCQWAPQVVELVCSYTLSLECDVLISPFLVKFSPLHIPIAVQWPQMMQHDHLWRCSRMLMRGMPFATPLLDNWVGHYLLDSYILFSYCDTEMRTFWPDSDLILEKPTILTRDYHTSSMGCHWAQLDLHQQKRALLAMPYRISTLQHPLPINSKYIQGD